MKLQLVIGRQYRGTFSRFFFVFTQHLAICWHIWKMDTFLQWHNDAFPVSM